MDMDNQKTFVSAGAGERSAEGSAKSLATALPASQLVSHHFSLTPTRKHNVRCPISISCSTAYCAKPLHPMHPSQRAEAFLPHLIMEANSYNTSICFLDIQDVEGQ